jgi:hypothetical protein
MQFFFTFCKNVPQFVLNISQPTFLCPILTDFPLQSYHYQHARNEPGTVDPVIAVECDLGRDTSF